MPHTSRTSTGALAAAGALLVIGAAVTSGSGGVQADSVEAGARTCFDLAGAPGDSALVNLTAVGSLARGSGQLVSSDIATPPVYSNVNFEPGAIDPNVAVSAIGADGQACFVNNSPARTGIIADHMGTIAAASYTQATPSGAPARVVDTRRSLGGTRLAPGARLCFAVDGAPGDAAVVNLTPVLASASGNGKLVSSDVAAPPVFSNVNYSPGSIDPNVAVSAVGADGSVCFVNSDLASVDLIADHMGTIAADSYVQATPSGAPTRVVDTRSAVGGTRLAPGTRLCFAVDGAPGNAAVVNLTPVRAEGTGNGQLVSSDIASPTVYSNANWTLGSTDPNVAVSTIGADGRVCFVNNALGAVDLIADHMGTIAAAAYTPASPTGAPVRVLDSRLTASRADLVLADNAVGGARFGRDAASTVEYFTSGLGAPVSDNVDVFPVPNSFSGFESADGTVGFAHPHYRQVCFNNSFCAYFGGPAADALSFVGFVQSSNAAPAFPLETRSGATVGDRGDMFPSAIVVNNGGCFSFGTGTVDGLDASLRSAGVPFLEVTPDGGFITNTPPLSDVFVMAIFDGDQPVDLEGDC